MMVWCFVQQVDGQEVFMFVSYRDHMMIETFFVCADPTNDPIYDLKSLRSTPRILLSVATHVNVLDMIWIVIVDEIKIR